VSIAGRKISTTFWGRAWCDNLECTAISATVASRPNLRSQRIGVGPAHLTAGKVTSIVCGSELYRIAIKIKTPEWASWKKRFRTKCGQRIGSLVELLAGETIQ